ncbi:peptidase E [Spongiivirga citrea]|uniref:Peptidase E n=1 Tax=Spongiivirga citrea TaxID=1481457 RepID=A0A6M0CKX0_9FLAO|nr:peptidase E [Spongiivirga citrea]
MAQSKTGHNLQITIRLFIDDFEDVLQERYDQSIILNEDNNPALIENSIGKYLSKKLNIKLNGKDATLNYLGKEYDNDIVKCYVEIENTNEIKSVSVTNKLLFDLFEEQQNIVHLRLKGKRKSFVLIKENDKGMLNF